MADADIPKFKAYAEGEAIPPVDPEDIQRWWEYEHTHSRVGANGCKVCKQRLAPPKQTSQTFRAVTE